MPRDWDRYEAVTRAALDRLAWLEGRWSGEGSSYGRPLRGTLVARRILGDTLLEVRETLRLPDGTLDYEDVAFYRYEPAERGWKVTHIQAPAWVRERVVLLDDGGGLRWLAGPEEPVVRLRLDGEALVVEVRFPGQEAPASAMRYAREPA